MSVFGGIVQKTGSGGSAGAWQKNNTDRIKAACIGAGASGFRDDDGDEDGGGGGGGGRAAGVTNINIGETISWKQGNKSPQQSSGKGGTNGSDSYVRRANGANIALATGGNTGTDDSGGGGGGNGTGNLVAQTGGSGSDDDDGRDGGNAAGCSKCGNNKGGQGATVSWSGDNPNFGCTGCPGGRNGPAYGGGGAGNEDDGTSGSGGQGYAGWAWYWTDPQISTVTVTNQFNQNPTTSGNIQSNPSDQVSISWSTNYTNKVEVRDGNTVVYTDNNGGGGSASIKTGLQSNANSNSPAQKTYTIRAYGYGGNFVQTNVTANVKNDWTPNTSNTYITKTFSNQPPLQTVTLLLGTVNAVDMPVWGWVNKAGCSLGNTIAANSNPFRFDNGNNIYLKVPTPYYEVDITGKTSSNTGNIASTTFTMYLGSQSFNITVNVAAPVIQEDFDFSDVTGKFPNPDVDVLDNDEVYNNNANSHFMTPNITVGEIELSTSQINNNIGAGEISTEIKSDNPNVQVQINSGAWQNVREI